MEKNNEYETLQEIKYKLFQEKLIAILDCNTTDIEYLSKLIDLISKELDKFNI